MNYDIATFGAYIHYKVFIVDLNLNLTGSPLFSLVTLVTILVQIAITALGR